MDLIENLLASEIKASLNTCFGITADDKLTKVEITNKEYEGDYTLVVFPFLREAKMKPEMLAETLGKDLTERVKEIASFNVVKGFLNFVISETYWKSLLQKIVSVDNYGMSETNSKPRIMVEYCSPNTNKPLHLGHLRNNFLGYSVAEILKAYGHDVTKVQIVNDRGIHICKSMLAWKNYGNGETPESSGTKGDKLVGKYYVKFDQIYKAEIAKLIAAGQSIEDAEKNAPSILEAREILLKWEQKDPEVYALWKMMNGWVYAGFDESLKLMGVDIDKNYYESETYLLGKDIIMDGLAKGDFYQKQDGSIWVDLTAEGLDHKILLRSDGTSVYMTQDIGTAIQRFKDFPDLISQIYTVGNEQDYHFRVLFLILQKLGYTWADSCFHLSYGMVDLPEGKMKSREGTVVDADDLIYQMSDTAEQITEELGKLDGMDEAEKKELYLTIGLGAIKYFLLKVDPKKRLLFNPKESIDFNGNTGPFIQYTHARIHSLIKKYGEEISADVDLESAFNDSEISLIKLFHEFPAVIKSAAQGYSPAIIANYAYQVVKQFNSFYQSTNILKEENVNIKSNRMILVKKSGEIIRLSMKMLGINVPNRM